MGWTRPPREAWVEKSEADAFDFKSSALVSTEELLQNPGQLPAEGRDVVYFFQRDCSYLGPSTARSYALHMAREVSMWAAGGAAMCVLGALSTALTGGTLGGTESLIVVGLLMGSALTSGVYAGHKNYGLRREAYPLHGECIPGKLVHADSVDGARRYLTFYPHGNREKPVRLESHARGEIIAGGEPTATFRAPGTAWWDDATQVVRKKLAFESLG